MRSEPKTYREILNHEYKYCKYPRGDAQPNGPKLKATLNIFREFVWKKIRKQESNITVKMKELSPDELKHFQEIELNMNSWLSAKEELMNPLL